MLRSQMDLYTMEMVLGSQYWQNYISNGCVLCVHYTYILNIQVNSVDQKGVNVRYLGSVWKIGAIVVWSESIYTIHNSFSQPEIRQSSHDTIIFSWIQLHEWPWPRHSLIRGILTQSCSAGAKNFTKCVFYHVQFSGVIQNIAYHRAIFTLFVYVDYYQNNQFY